MRTLAFWAGLGILLALVVDMATFILYDRKPVGRVGYIGLHVALVLSVVLILWGAP